MLVKLNLLLLFLCFSICLHAQKKNEGYQLHIRKTNERVLVDGVGDDLAWKNADIAGDFYMVLPMDTSSAKTRTDVRMTYDDRNLYLLAECYKPVQGPYYVESLKRDFAFGKNDNFLLFMDPFQDQTNGFSFGANAAGAQWDGTMYAGGSVDLNWDNKWISVVKNDQEKWVLEMAIPFTTIRFKRGITKWGINFSRLDLKTAEKSSWAPVPRQFPTASLAYTGNLIWDASPPSPGTNISIIPYVLGGLSKDYERKTKNIYQKKAGADIKLGITSSLNLDLTINPDFSQVEVDRQVTNLDRYELFFPERRQFFLENGDLFANFGYANIRPFFSRRIGLGVPIRAGARLSGNLNKNWRLGIMDMQTARVKDRGLPDQNFSVLALQRKVFSRSNISFLFVNKESLNNIAVDSTKPVYNRYNRNIGIEYNLASQNNMWTGKALFLKSFTPNQDKKDIVGAAHLQYASRKWNILLQQEYIGRNFNAEVGYVPRNGHYKINPQLSYLFFPKKRGRVLSHGPRLGSIYFFNTDFNRTDNQSIFSYLVNFRNQSTFNVSAVDEFVNLLVPFDPTNTGKDTLARGTTHQMNAWRTEFVSKPQSVFTYSFSSHYGSYYEGGKRLNITGQAGYRFQPYVSISGNFSYNNIDLPQPWNKTVFWLIGSQLDITLTNTLFLSTFFQYNEQSHNINLNTRFQWRYKPASDLFIVYTDNYLPAPFSVRNRALVLKLNYWWNPKTRHL